MTAIVEKVWVSHELPCVVLANSTGSRCGYVGVPESHPYFGLDYNCGETTAELEVHGGLTYARAEKGDDWRKSPDGKHWWFGFDCAHCDDAKDMSLITDERLQGIYKEFGPEEGHVWTCDEVAGECESLAKQLSEAM